VTIKQSGLEPGGLQAVGTSIKMGVQDQNQGLPRAKRTQCHCGQMG